MGVRRNFSREGATSIYYSYFSGCWHCNSFESSQNALLFLRHKENAPWKHVLHLHLSPAVLQWPAVLKLNRKLQ